MESILHIQPISRNVDKPLCVGHSDYISVGKMSFDDEEDPVDEHAVQMLVGSPLVPVDHGSNRSHVPLFKSFECMPDSGRPGHQLYLETIHYLNDSRYLIPVRTKIQSGTSQGLRIGHLPSMNFIRLALSGDRVGVYDNRSMIITELLDRDGPLQKIKHRSVFDWVRDELVPYLDGSNSTEINFNVDSIESKIDNFRTAIMSAPHDISSHHVKDILRIVDFENKSYPIPYYSKDVVSHRIDDIERLCVPHSLDLRSYGKLDLSNMGRVDYNPAAFQKVCDLIDNIPLTDFNVEIICDTDGSTLFYHEHFAVHRLACLADHDLGAWNTDSLLHDLICQDTLAKIRKLFLQYHSQLNNRSYEILQNLPVKMKLVKTIEDEACIILYESNSSDKAEPLCGVYFDIALQSIAPITISPSIIDF